MSLHEGALATARFEFRRSLTAGRLTAFLVLALFPPAITTVLSLLPVGPPLEWPIGATTLVICLLSNMLWATPVVYNELEGKTWIFSAARPGGKMAVLLGKYVISVAWTTAVCLSAVTLSIAIAAWWQPGPDYTKIWGTLAGLAILSSIGYAAMFTMIGTLFHRRSMMVAMGYCIISEVAIAQIPAVIGKLTISSHLYHVILHSFAPKEWLESPDLIAVVGEQAIGLRCFAILLIAGVAMAASLFVIRNREYLTTDES
ncbi:MAG: hypothetical protein VX084_06805 [Planctomycetota bacterium]|nr:hypothetical protein [Planctomycetota bacterium]